MKLPSYRFFAWVHRDPSSLISYVPLFIVNIDTTLLDVKCQASYLCFSSYSPLSSSTDIEVGQMAFSRLQVLINEIYRT
jgi:hypothetical protein